MRVAVSRAPGAERVVSPLELFFDLVYVFALGQLSHHLLEHIDFRTGAETRRAFTRAKVSEEQPSRVLATPLAEFAHCSSKPTLENHARCSSKVVAVGHPSACYRRLG
jgi:hypothetical protein